MASNLVMRKTSQVICHHIIIYFLSRSFQSHHSALSAAICLSLGLCKGTECDLWKPSVQISIDHVSPIHSDWGNPSLYLANHIRLMPLGSSLTPRSLGPTPARSKKIIIFYTLSCSWLEVENSFLILQLKNLCGSMIKICKKFMNFLPT